MKVLDTDQHGHDLKHLGAHVLKFRMEMNKNLKLNVFYINIMVFFSIMKRFQFTNYITYFQTFKKCIAEIVCMLMLVSFPMQREVI